jgi:hypothetical protein
MQDAPIEISNQSTATATGLTHMIEPVVEAADRRKCASFIHDWAARYGTARRGEMSFLHDWVLGTRQTDVTTWGS